MTITLLKNNYLVKPQKLVLRTKGGIVLTKDARKTSTRTGVVTALGPLCKNVRLGASIIYSQYCGTEVLDENDENDEKYLIMSEDDILATFEE